MRFSALLLLPVLLVPACTGSSPSSSAVDSSSGGGDEVLSAELRTPQATTAVVPGTSAADLAVATSQALYEQAPVVVLAPVGDAAAQARAASVAVSLGAPLLISPAASAGGGQQGSASSADSAVAEEVARLGPEAVLAVGDGSAQWAEQLDDVDVVVAPAGAEELADMTGADLSPAQPLAAAELLTGTAALTREQSVPLLEVTGAAAAAPTAEADDAGSQDAGTLPQTQPPAALEDTLVLASGDTLEAVAAVATARAAGADVRVLAGADPRGDAELVAALAAARPATVLGLGDGFGTDEQFGHTVDVAATGVELPGGGQLVLPGKMYVALYGHPGSKALGVLGEQGPAGAVERARQVAAQYEAAGSEHPVIPTFEIITTVASAALGDGDYSDEATVEHIRPMVDAAAEAGVYVVLDLQPGYDDFLTQAKMYEEVLRLPHVGLALDPEWRLKPGERHMRQIGRVSAAEVNEVGEWLAALVRDNALPQKMLLLHQFKSFMLEDRDQVVADRPELAVVTQMDGHGAPSTKMETWRIILQDPPAGMVFGWKNFYDEDSPTMTPAQTLAVEPTPVFVSYQ